jgi:hypothetical protein
MFIGNLKALTNHDIVRMVDKLKIKDFRGVFMRGTLPSKINTTVNSRFKIPFRGQPSRILNRGVS